MKVHYLLMVLLKVRQFLGEAFKLGLQIRPVHGQVIKNSAQTIDICFNALAEEELIFKSERRRNRDDYGERAQENDSILAIYQDTKRKGQH